MNASTEFPSNFVWGTATASYQIEGAVDQGGRGKSIWDTFSAEPGNVTDGHTGDPACDHYNRYEEDVALMKEIGLDAYRFSIAWPRIYPEGTGKVNEEGLDFYDKLIDELLGANIEPYVTLYHWDLPQALQEKGGWANKDSPEWFGEYSETVHDRLGDRVKNWITHNEPWVVAFLGYAYGEHAPGIKDFSTALKVSHNLLVSHGIATKKLRNNSDEDNNVGITLNLYPTYASNETEEDQLAKKICDGYHNRWFLDPVFRGYYPDDMLEFYERNFELPSINSSELELISQPLDYLGINYYTRSLVKWDENEELNFRKIQPDDAEVTDMGWEIYPQGLPDLLSRVDKDYDPGQMYITENGAAFKDQLTQDNSVHDEKRIEYLSDHFEALSTVLEEDIPLKGYFLWTLMDNFEWSHGYTKRFGIVYTDFKNKLNRIPKDSAGYYKKFITAQT